MENFKLIVHEQPVVSLIALLRKHTHQPMSKLKTALELKLPVIDEDTHHNTYNNFIERTTELLDELSHSSYSFSCLVDGQEESIEYVRNCFQSWHEIVAEIDAEDELRSLDE